jgi:hypothetical protein
VAFTAFNTTHFINSDFALIHDQENLEIKSPKGVKIFIILSPEKLDYQTYG